MQFSVTLHIETDNPAAVEEELENVVLEHGEITDVGPLEHVD